METDLTRNPPPITDTKPVAKQSNFVITLLSILLIISCLIAGFFAYQTQKLVKELSEFRSQNLATPTPTPASDPTTGWKTYTDEKGLFSFKYPNTIFLKPNPVGLVVAYPENKKDDPYFEQNYSDFHISSTFSQQDQRFDTAISQAEEYFKPYKNFESTNLGNGIVKMSGVLNDDGKKTIRAFYNHEGKAIEITYRQNDWTITPESFDEILSTFKFVESKTSAEPVACTMDAKICPDGSAVGRSGPKCEFAPCPTPKS